MNGLDIAIIVIVAAVVIGVTARLIYKRIKGKGGCCGCDCGCCDKCKK